MQHKQRGWILGLVVALVALSLAVACGSSSTPAPPTVAAPTKAAAALAPT